MSTILPLFWHLSSSAKKTRFDATIKLISTLEQFQTQFEIKGSSPETSDEEDEDKPRTDGLDTLNAQDVSYSIRRLVRGLGSSRESSRLGFAVALSELLSRIQTTTCSQIVSLVMDSSQTVGSMTGQEERDALFARLFGLTTIIQSGLLVRSSALPSSALPASSLFSYTEVVKQLLILGEKKSWLRESAWWSLALAVEALHTSEVKWKNEAISITTDNIFIENKTWSQEKIALAAKLQALYPHLEWRTFLLPSFKNSELLSVGNLGTLARILKQSNADEDEEVPISTFGLWKPQTHFVWDILLNQLLPSPDSPTPPKGSFREFFRIVVDESLFSSTASPEKKYWGFQIFQKALKRVTEGDIPLLFTKNFMRSWINHLSHNDRYLHKAARQVTAEVQACVQKNPDLGFPLILQLTGVHGSRQFDHLTNTKTVESILSSMSVEGIKIYIEQLFRQVNGSDESGEQTDAQTINSKRIWIIDQLATLIRNTSIPKNDEWIQSVLGWLIVNGLFIVRKTSSKSQHCALHSIPSPVFSDELRQNCRTRLLTCLSDLNGQMVTVKIAGQDRIVKMSAVTSDGELWVRRALNTIEALQKDTKHVESIASLDEDEIVLRNSAQECIERLRKVTGEKQEAARGAELLLAGTLLQQYCIDASDDEINTETLEACIDGASRMFPAMSKKSKKSRKSTDGDNDEALEPVDVLVDAIIGFLDKSTAYTRSISNQAFSSLTGVVRESTIDLVLTQLERRHPAEEEQMEDVEQEQDSVEETSSSSLEDSDEDSNDEPPDLELRRKIEEALQVNGVDLATDGSDDSDEELMDDDQMMAIDEHLAEIFRARTNEKNGGKDVNAQREATHFKNRVLDLVEIFVKRQPTSPLLMRFILPLVDLVVGTGTDEKQLSEKASGLLRNRIGKLRDSPPRVDGETVLEVLDGLHSKARKIRSSDLLPTLSQCSLYLVKLALQANAEERVLQVYRQSLADFITRKASPLNSKFFEDFVHRYPASSWQLRNDFLVNRDKAANAYRQCQTFQLLHLLVNPQNFGDRKEEFMKFVVQLRDSLYQAISDACDDTVIFTAAQVKELLKIGLDAVRQTKNLAPTFEALETAWEPDTWATLSTKLATTNRFKTSVALHNMCSQIAHISRPSDTAKQIKSTSKSNVTRKRKAGTSQVSVDEEPGKPKHKKARKNKKSNTMSI